MNNRRFHENHISFGFPLLRVRVTMAPDMTLANKITITRILMIPLFVIAAMYYGKTVQQGQPQDWMRWTSIAIFVLAAASDGIDGYIARRYNQKSRLGVILDPIADKGLLVTSIITLSVSNWHYEFPLWFPIVVISRDIIILTGAGALQMLNGKVDLRVRWTGKVATALQMIALSGCMLQFNPWKGRLHLGFGAMDVTFLDFSVALAGLFTMISGLNYVLDGLRQLHARGHGDPKPWNED